MTIERYSTKIKTIDLEDYPRGKRANFFARVYQQATGVSLKVPVIAARGAHDGPTLGITAAVHGNELNGLRIIHAILEDLDLSQLRGNLLCVPVVNVPAFNLGQRNFLDDVDLNHAFPGKANGKPSEQYARAFVKTFIPAIDYLIDIHTASEGRLNTLYVRADLESAETHELAMNINPEIILHARGGDGTLRAVARQHGIPAITVEAGNPSVIQGRMIYDGEVGIRNVMTTLGMIDGHITVNRNPIICSSSQWIRTNGGGLLRTKFKLKDKIRAKQVLAYTVDMFGERQQTYKAPYGGVVIGMAANPVAIPGTRFCHLGKIDDPPSVKVKE